MFDQPAFFAAASVSYTMKLCFCRDIGFAASLKHTDKIQI